ncbi:hypothetical protein CCM_00339 [Cordyceps militaris CM01]|uniref:Uncharacterized protein n=1 Tax=Cordyceps militaris (strain CM01) TaxID=983644 RepID=G3J3K9_CORMM|nr:uncharacterized protein CCM_00339 [Cordyceps militaris CM01]EGX95685.1 hypothetical protein CCM_00339 [Cordyceps militaris CM01]
MYRFLQVAKASTKAILHGEMKGDRGLKTDKDAGAGPRKILNEPRDTTCIRGWLPVPWKQDDACQRKKKARRRRRGCMSSLAPFATTNMHGLASAFSGSHRAKAEHRGWPVDNVLKSKNQV